ncbi:hypothetical protein [Hoylesella buccalis]|uniref:hypothetical protein n=1 Tax=Hoylesella buccalis TaxID=28127 RepID=UPI0015E06EC1|nr:hypothetical protein [Hoylesella buccalis]
MLQPVFIRADASHKTDKDKQLPTSPKQRSAVSVGHASSNWASYNIFDEQKRI